MPQVIQTDHAHADVEITKISAEKIINEYLGIAAAFLHSNCHHSDTHLEEG